MSQEKNFKTLQQIATWSRHSVWKPHEPQRRAPGNLVMDSSPHSPLLELPAELLHTIFAHLDLEDVLTARKACSTLAAIGVDHFGDEVALVYHHEKFKALTQIAKHPGLAKRMRSLFYAVDRFKELSFEEWVDKRVSEEPFLADNCSAEESYREFLEVCRQQVKIHDERYDYSCLRSFFQGSCNIREVTMVSHAHCERELGAEKTAFGKSMMRPHRDKSWSDAGTDQVCSMAHAIQHSGLQLDSLTIAGVSHTIFDTSTDRGVSTYYALKAIMPPPTSTRVFIQAWPPELIDQDEESEDSDWQPDIDKDLLQSVREQSVSVFEEGYVGKILAEARDLPVLKLEVPVLDPYYDASGIVRIHRTLRRLESPHLYELALSQCAMRGKWLVDFLLRHKTTLRRVSLRHVSLRERQPSWRNVFTRISCQLPHLNKLALEGEFHRDSHPQLLFGYASAALSYSKAMEKFVIRGGAYPSWTAIKRQLLYGPSAEESANESVDSVPWNPPEDDLQPDDPKLDYSTDEYDE